MIKSCMSLKNWDRCKFKIEEHVNYKACESPYAHICPIDIENKTQRLIDALKFYAEGRHYNEYSTGHGTSLFRMHKVIMDKGEVATKALDAYYEPGEIT